jgi:hypothetical protein
MASAIHFKKPNCYESKINLSGSATQEAFQCEPAVATPVAFTLFCFEGDPRVAAPIYFEKLSRCNLFIAEG